MAHVPFAFTLVVVVGLLGFEAWLLKRGWYRRRRLDFSPGNWALLFLVGAGLLAIYRQWWWALFAFAGSCVSAYWARRRWRERR